MTTASTAAEASPFGARLRQWRQQRGLGQLSLAGQVGSTGPGLFGRDLVGVNFVRDRQLARGPLGRAGLPVVPDR